MKKRIFGILILAILSALVILAGCSNEKKSESSIEQTAAMDYSCPMHPEVTSDKPGTCPKCNMFLVHKDSLDVEGMHHAPAQEAVYTCPMHPEVTSDKPGVCPKCNMNLELKETTVPDTMSSDDQSSVQQYTCGMHPQIVTNEPGLCPICNMELVPKSSLSEAGTIKVNAMTQVQMGLEISQVSKRQITKSIRAFGKVAYSEPDNYSINIKFPGWVEKLYVNQTGTRVTKGQPLLEIYSPELVAAQEEYLIAWRTMMAMHLEDSIPTKLVSASIQKLKNWDITDAQIQELAQSKKTKRTMAIISPYDGIVTSKNVKEGDNVMSGQELFQLSELSTVWVTAYVFEQDFPFVRKGQSAEVLSPSMPGASFKSDIIYVSPFLDENRQAEIRLAVDNEKLDLKPNMYAEVKISSSLPHEVLTVPRSSVIKTGTREIVFVSTGVGEFQAREVMTGLLGDGDRIEIKSGLDEGDFVVTSGQFMLDSESRLSEAISGKVHSH
ncbi:MAG TPA: efflux RND transporter periplasmic adaptor subunit [candidate division Zixibacteria bacterium]|nr:efflux RND transporter periplasmic adaptor subunit [candidate division Zixibacteria bacterium]